MMEADQNLLRRFIDTQDADAFAGIVRRHTALVFHTCLRVLADRHAAEDAAQETFHRLMLRPETVTASLPAWLHCVATRLSIDRLRHETARQRRELAYETRHEQRRDEDAAWVDVSQRIDQALASLNESDRSLLVEHFLLGRSQVELANAKGVSKATMCRRINGALERLKSTARPGTTLGTALVVATLDSSAEAVPLNLQYELSKMSMLSGVTVPASSGWLGLTLQSWGWLALMGSGFAALGSLAVAAILFIPPATPAGATYPSLEQVGERAAQAVISDETPPPSDPLAGSVVHVAPADERMSPQQIVAFRIDGGQVALVFADTHVSTLSLDLARPLIERQTGLTMEALAARSRAAGETR